MEQKKPETPAERHASEMDRQISAELKRTGKFPKFVLDEDGWKRCPVCERQLSRCECYL